MKTFVATSRVSAFSSVDARGGLSRCPPWDAGLQRRAELVDVAGESVAGERLLHDPPMHPVFVEAHQHQAPR